MEIYHNRKRNFVIRMNRKGVQVYSGELPNIIVRRYFFNPFENIRRLIFNWHAEWADDRLEQTKWRSWIPINDSVIRLAKMTKEEFADAVGYGNIQVMAKKMEFLASVNEEHSLMMKDQERHNAERERQRETYEGKKS